MWNESYFLVLTHFEVRGIIARIAIALGMSYSGLD